MDCQFGDTDTDIQGLLVFGRILKCGPNGLTLRGGQRIRPNSKIKIPAPPLLLIFFDFSRKKIKFIVLGEGGCNCTPFAQQQISGNCG